MKVDVMFQCEKSHDRVYFDAWDCPVCAVRDAASEVSDERLFAFVTASHRVGAIDLGPQSP